MILLIILTLIILESMWDGFRTRRDFTNPTSEKEKYSLYDKIWHTAKVFYIALWAAVPVLIFIYHPKITIHNYFVIVGYGVMLRFGIFDALFNIWNYSNRSLNYLRVNNWAYKLLYHIFQDNTTSWIWYFKFLATFISVAMLIFGV